MVGVGKDRRKTKESEHPPSPNLYGGDVGPNIIHHATEHSVDRNIKICPVATEIENKAHIVAEDSVA